MSTGVMGLLHRIATALGLTLPSFDDIRQMNHEACATLSRGEVLAKIEAFGVLAGPDVAEQREELLERTRRGRFDHAARQRCDTLVREAARIKGVLIRPGTVEEFWYFEGLLLRLVALDTGA